MKELKDWDDSKGNTPVQRQLTGVTKQFSLEVIVTMPAATLVKPALQNQVSPVRDKESALAPSHQSEIINPSRNINKRDEVYLRDYTIAASVISWDMGIYDTAATVKPEDITNIAIDGDTVWYQLDHSKAIPLNIEVFHSHRLQIQQQQTTWVQELSSYCNEQEDEGVRDGDVATVATVSAQPPEASTKAEWTVEYDPQWCLYQAWMGNHCIGKAGTYSKAARLASAVRRHRLIS